MATAATTAGAYVRHDPTQTTLHALVAKHLETFLAFAAERSGRALPRYVVEEFRGYLRCGVLPDVRLRHWVLSVPYELRRVLAADALGGHVRAARGARHAAAWCWTSWTCRS